MAEGAERFRGLWEDEMFALSSETISSHTFFAPRSSGGSRHLQHGARPRLEDHGLLASDRRTARKILFAQL